MVPRLLLDFTARAQSTDDPGDAESPMTRSHRLPRGRLTRPIPGRRAPWFEEVEPRLAPAVFTVTTFLDSADAGHGVLSLREAIHLANADEGQDTIRFNLAQPAPIVLTSALPTITHSVILDGWSQNGSSPPSTPTIELSGENLTGGESGLVIAASDTRICGLVIRDFGGYGIVIDGGTGFSVGNVTIQGNRIGTDQTGAERRPNQLGGILVRHSSDNLIGGSAPGLGNLVSGNDGVGITLVGSGEILIQPETNGAVEALLAGAGNQNTTTRNRIIGNVIGLAASGDSPLGNRGHGVWLDRAGGNWLGGAGAGEGNTISGNGRAAEAGGQVTDLDPLAAADGIRITGSAIDPLDPQALSESAWNRIQGNRIGTDSTGSISFSAGGAAWFGNTGDGVRLGDLALRLAQRDAGAAVSLHAGPRHTLVGVWPSVSLGGANIIGGNDGNGITIDGPGVGISEVAVSIPAASTFCNL